MTTIAFPFVRGALAAAAILSPILAQGVVGPTVLGGPYHPAGLSPGQVPAAEVLQVQLARLPGDPLGTWTVAMTVVGLSPAWGGQGGSDLLIGRYDPVAENFLPTLVAAQCNTPGTEFGAMLDSRGLELVFERDGFAHRARRSTVAGSFDPGRRIENLPDHPYYDPAIGNVNGQRVLFYVADGSIRMARFDDGVGDVLGPGIVVVQPVQPGATPNSPTPLFDLRGDVRGLSHHELLGSDNDHYLTLDLDPATPSHLVLDTPTWLNNGGFAGGKFFSAENAPSPYHVVGLDTVWMTGAEAQVGTSLRASMFVPPSAGDVSFSWLLFGAAYSPFPLPLPGIQGKLGLDPGSVFASVPVGSHIARTGEVAYVLIVPNDPALAGAVVPTQGVTQRNGQFLFTNTSSLRVGLGGPSRTLSLAYDGSMRVLQSPIDPNDPGLVVALAPNAPIPIEIVALDLVGVPIGDPTQILPGGVAALYDSTAASYVALMPFATGWTTTVTLFAGAGALCKPIKKSGYCHRRDEWSTVDLPKAGRLCIEVQPQVDKKATDCNPVQFEVWSKVGGAWIQDPSGSGSVDSSTDVATTVCAEPRAGATDRQLRYRCPGDYPKRCRVTINVWDVKDCKDCPAGTAKKKT